MTAKSYNTAKPSGTVKAPPVTQGSHHEYMISGTAPSAANTGAAGKPTVKQKY